MPWSEAEIQANREYFGRKLNAIKERNAVVKAIEHDSFDFILLDTRPRDAFRFGHITGAWCAPFAGLDEVMSLLPKDREVVTYCWGHD
jgi:rhodanese-related sulfurtransferase